MSKNLSDSVENLVALSTLLYFALQPETLWQHQHHHLLLVKPSETKFPLEHLNGPRYSITLPNRLYKTSIVDIYEYARTHGQVRLHIAAIYHLFNFFSIFTTCSCNNQLDGSSIYNIPPRSPIRLAVRNSWLMRFHGNININLLQTRSY